MEREELGGELRGPPRETPSLTRARAERAPVPQRAQSTFDLRGADALEFVLVVSHGDRLAISAKPTCDVSPRAPEDRPVDVSQERQEVIRGRDERRRGQEEGLRDRVPDLHLSLHLDVVPNGPSREALDHREVEMIAAPGGLAVGRAGRAATASTLERARAAPVATRLRRKRPPPEGGGLVRRLKSTNASRVTQTIDLLGDVEVSVMLGLHVLLRDHLVCDVSARVRGHAPAGLRRDGLTSVHGRRLGIGGARSSAPLTRGRARPARRAMDRARPRALRRGIDARSEGHPPGAPAIPPP